MTTSLPLAQSHASERNESDDIVAILALVFVELAESAKDYVLSVAAETDGALGRIEEELAK